MTDFKNDIEKYRKGEMTSAEMHALEKKALSDPFLADALEGAGSISPEKFSADISEIKRKLESQRKKIVWFTPLRVAAGIALLMFSIFLIYNFNQPEEQLALQKEEVPTPSSSSLGDLASKKDQPELLTLSQPKEETKTDLKAESGLSDLKVNGSGATKPNAGISTSSQTTAGVQDPSKADQAIESELSEIVTEEKTLERDKVAAVEPAQQGLKKEAVDNDFVSRSQARKSKLSDDVTLQRIVSGQVMLAEDNLPVPGVSVTIKGTTDRTVTDMQGNYTIPLENEKQKLVFSYIGLQTSEVFPDDKSMVNVNLLEDESQLSEVVVTGKGFSTSIRDENQATTIKLAEPSGGKKEYNQYLESNLNFPQEAIESKVKGKVIIEFKVGNNGTLSDFSVLKGLGHGCDEEVIRLVKEGPKWTTGIIDNIAIESYVRVKMKFDFEKAKK